MNADRQITLQEVAERLNVHYMTAYRYVRTGRLSARREGGHYQVSAAEVERLRSQKPPRRGRARSANRGRLEDRLVAGDEGGAWAVIEAALASGMEPTAVYLDLLGPALRSIGDRWARGQLSVADEQLAARYPYEPRQLPIARLTSAWSPMSWASPTWAYGAGRAALRTRWPVRRCCLIG